jgi:tRNA (cmo5U34)-methyltransferase
VSRPAEEWRDAEHIDRYLARASEFPRRAEGESALLEKVPADVWRILDLGTGDGHTLALLLAARPEATGVGLDFSEPMLAAARERFADEPRAEIAEHDLGKPLQALGSFDLVLSSFVIHHLEDERKRALYAEAFALLEPGGVFANLEHVASPSERLHREFFLAIEEPIENEDPSDRTLDVETQLTWLRKIGFEDVECHWKWREMALLVGIKPGA